MNESNVEKLQTIGKWGSRLTLLGMVFCAVVLVACVAAGIIATIRPELLGHFPDVIGLKEFQIAAAMGAVDIAVLGVIIYLADGVMRNIRTSHSPFTDGNAEQIKNMSYVMLVYAILIPLISWTVMAVALPGVEATIPFSLGMILVAVLFYMLSLVFEYGAGLQNDSDHTL